MLHWWFLKLHNLHGAFTAIESNFRTFTNPKAPSHPAGKQWPHVKDHTKACRQGVSWSRKEAEVLIPTLLSLLPCPALPCPAQAWPSPPLSWTTDPGQPSHLLLLQTWASLLLSETPKLPADPWCQGTRGILNTNRNKPSSTCPPPPSPPATPRGAPSATHTPLSIKEGTAFAQRLTGGQLSG